MSLLEVEFLGYCFGVTALEAGVVVVREIIYCSVYQELLDSPCLNTILSQKVPFDLSTSRNRRSESTHKVNFIVLRQRNCAVAIKAALVEIKRMR